MPISEVNVVDYRLAVGNSGFLRTLLGFGTIAVLLALSTFATAWLLTPAASNDNKPLPGPLVARFGAGVLVGTLVLGLIHSLHGGAIRQNFPHSLLLYVL